MNGSKLPTTGSSMVTSCPLRLDPTGCPVAIDIKAWKAFNAGQRYDDLSEAGMSKCHLKMLYVSVLVKSSYVLPYPLIVSANAQLWFSSCSSSFNSTPPSFVTTAIEYLSRLLASL